MLELRGVHRLDQRAVEEILDVIRGEFTSEHVKLRVERRNTDVLVTVGDMRRRQVSVRVDTVSVEIHRVIFQHVEFGVNVVGRGAVEHHPERRVPATPRVVPVGASHNNRSDAAIC